MFDPLHNAALFLINTLFDIYLVILMIRFILAGVQADEFNPVSRFIITATQSIIRPLRKVIPNVGRIELATLFVIIILAILKYLCIGLLVFGMPKIVGLIILGLAETLKLMANTFFYAIILQVIFSWINQIQSPVGRILTQMVSPIMSPLQGMIPPIAGIDITPVPALVILQLVIIGLINPIYALGLNLAFS